MPCMLPALAIGKDVFLYAPSNEGRPYKLGYTLGVNLCGARFFGLLYRQAGLRRPPCDSRASR